jgi:hypothetical protein
MIKRKLTTNCGSIKGDGVTIIAPVCACVASVATSIIEPFEAAIGLQTKKRPFL